MSYTMLKPLSRLLQRVTIATKQVSPSEPRGAAGDTKSVCSTFGKLKPFTCCREAAAAKRDELKKAEEQLMEARRQELLNEEDGYWRQRMDQQQLVEKLKAEVAEQQEELTGHSEVGL